MSKVVLGVAGGIAAYKAVELLRQLTETGHDVTVVPTEAALEFVSRVFWFSLEFGVLREGGEVRTYGAGLLSSFGEIQQIERAKLRPLDVARMGVQEYDITHYQPLLFCGESFGEVEDVVGTFFATATDDTIAALLKPAGV